MLFVIAALIALVITLLFNYIFRNTGPWKGFWVFFGIIFLAAVAAGLWIPAGPFILEPRVYWAPVLIVALITALLLAASSPKPPVRGRVEMGEIVKGKLEEDQRAEERATTAFSIFLWIFFLGILALIAVGLLG